MGILETGETDKLGWWGRNMSFNAARLTCPIYIYLYRYIPIYRYLGWTAAFHTQTFNIKY